MRYRIQSIPSIDELAYTPLRGWRGQRAGGCSTSGCGFAFGYCYRRHSMYRVSPGWSCVGRSGGWGRRCSWWSGCTVALWRGDAGRAKVSGVDAGLPRLPHAPAVLQEDLGDAGHDVLGLVLSPDGRAKCAVVGEQARYRDAEQVAPAVRRWTAGEPLVAGDRGAARANVYRVYHNDSRPGAHRLCTHTHIYIYSPLKHAFRWRAGTGARMLLSKHCTPYITAWCPRTHVDRQREMSGSRMPPTDCNDKSRDDSHETMHLHVHIVGRWDGQRSHLPSLIAKCRVDIGP